MNSIILYPEEVTENTAFISSNRWEVIRTKVHSDKFRVGVLGKYTAIATLSEESNDGVMLCISEINEALERLPISLFVGLSRPPTIRKVISIATMMGVRELHFIQTENGEKSYIQSNMLKEPKLSQEIEKALEQACDCIPPIVEIHDNWRFFMNEKLPNLLKSNSHKYFFDTLNSEIKATTKADHSALFFGPEAGLSENEVSDLKAQGFKSVSLGKRVLRVEVAVAAAIGMIL